MRVDTTTYAIDKKYKKRGMTYFGDVGFFSNEFLVRGSSVTAGNMNIF
jgi:hypothetical protein